MTMKLSQHELRWIGQGYDPKPRRSFSINTACYLEPKYLKIEQEQIFHKSWQFLCHEEKLCESGRYVATDIQGQSIVAIRDTDGELRAFYNVCQHRGHELVQGEGQTKLIVCPYHAWTYTLNGALHSARRSEALENFRVSDICLTQVQVETFCHFIFVNLDPTATPLAQQSGVLH